MTRINPISSIDNVEKITYLGGVSRTLVSYDNYTPFAKKLFSMIRSIFTLILALLLSMPTSAQKQAEIGLHLGVATYQGDLARGPFNSRELNPAIGVIYRKMFTPRLGLRAGATWARIAGNDADYNLDVRGIEMKSGLLEFAVHGEWHMMGRARFNNQGFFTRSFSPFISLGAGITFGGADVDITGTGSRFRPETEEATSFFVVPIGLGLRLDMSPAWTLTVDAASRPTFSDLLDGVKVNGNQNSNDWYFIGGLTILYTFQADNGPFNF